MITLVTYIHMYICDDGNVQSSKITTYGLQNLSSIYVHETHRLVLKKAWLKGHKRSRNIMHIYIHTKADQMIALLIMYVCIYLYSY
jgi:hypothetical protein